MRKEEFTALPLLVQQYLLYLEAIKGHSELSVLEYASDLRTVFRFMARYKRMIKSDIPDEEIDKEGDVTVSYGSNSSSMSSVFKDYKARLARFRKLVW